MDKRNVNIQTLANSINKPKHWNEIIGIGVSDPLMSISESNNGASHLTALSDNHKWYKATVHNSIIKYNNYMQNKGVSIVSNANVWVKEGRSFSGATVMMERYTWSTTYSALLADWLSWLSPLSLPGISVLNALFGHLYPDIIYTFDAKNTKKIDQLVFHESGHFSHALNAGSSYWGTVVNRETDNILSCNLDPYCDGNDPSVSSGQLIALVEGWATFTEYAVMKGYYTTDRRGINITNRMENYNMGTVPSTENDEDEGWFLTGLIWDIVDNQSDGLSKLKDGQTGVEINSIIDNLHRGNITSDFSPVFNRLTSSVDTGYDLKRALRTAYPSAVNQINELFESYGY